MKLNQLLIDYLAERLRDRELTGHDAPTGVELASIIAEFRPPDTSVTCPGGIQSATLICKDLTFHFDKNEIAKIEIPNDIGGTLVIRPRDSWTMTAENR